MSRPEQDSEALSQTLPRRCRLRKRWEFRRVQVEGRRVRMPDLIILWRRRPAGPSRLGVTVSRKVAKRAATRNRIKRWIRESFRRLPRRWRSPGLDVVIIAKPSAVARDFQAIQVQIERFWQGIRLRSQGSSRSS